MVRSVHAEEEMPSYSRSFLIKSAFSQPKYGETKSLSSSTGEAARRSIETTSSQTEPKLREARPCLGRQKPEIFDKYKLLKILGKGQYGTVFAVKERRPSKCEASTDSKTTGDESSKTQEPRMYACKVVDINTNGDDDALSSHQMSQSRDEVMNEIEMMLGPGGGHPNLQDLVDFVIEDDKAYIASSLCRGGDLAQALEMRGCLCEEDAMNVMAGILNGLAHLHSQGVGHGDIKLENILLTDSKYDMSKVKIIDMGFAKHLVSPDEATPRAEALNTVCGTPMYLAPELIRRTVRKQKVQCRARYGTQVDMWSCGVILYMLLSGFPPFDPCTSMLQMFEDIDKAEYDFSDSVWELVSDEALSMIEGLLEIDPAKRLTAEEALCHPWMAGR